MRRRAFITLIGSAAVWPLGVRAQRSERLRRIGLLVVEGLEPIGPFREALSELGYVEGRNIQIVTRSAQGQESRLPQLATDLVRDQVDVIVAVQTPAAHAAKNATRDIPIVVMAGDPIATGLINNLARPDGNLTGMSATAAEAAAKSLELIPEIVPGARRVGVLGNAEDLSFPKMSSGLDSLVRQNHCIIRADACRSECSFSTCSSRGAGLRPRTCFSVINSALP